MGDGKFNSGFWRFYSAPYRVFYEIFSGNVRSTRVLSISDYIAGLCKKAWGLDSDVVYFPVPYGNWKPVNNAEREGIVTIGRFSPEKNQLEQIKIAESLRGVGVKSPLNIVGAVSSSLNHRLYTQLRGEAEKRGISNLNFNPNVPQRKVISLAHSSKVFLHTMRNEHFGIATVEAIAAGCLPIVHDSGGSKEIVPIKELRFRTEGEAAEKVERALKGEFDRYLPELARNITRFSEDSFKEKVTGIILNEAA
jgi:glycosyltransferase involved in cell wall biosynthesis